MDPTLIIYIQVIHLVVIITSHYNYYEVQNPHMQNLHGIYYQPDSYEKQDLDYENDPQINYRRSRYRHHKHNAYVNSGGKLPSSDEDFTNHEESDECECSCSRCQDPEPCCRNVCNSCSPAVQPNLILIPYPYPFILKTKQEEIETTAEKKTPVTKATTPVPTTRITTTTITTSTKTTPPPVDNEKELSDDKMKRRMFKNTLRNSKYMLTSLKHTKPSWVAKYGIVPIPDKLAEKLMSQLRDARIVHPPRKRKDLDWLDF